MFLDDTLSQSVKTSSKITNHRLNINQHTLDTVWDSWKHTCLTLPSMIPDDEWRFEQGEESMSMFHVPSETTVILSLKKLIKLRLSPNAITLGVCKWSVGYLCDSFPVTAIL